MVPSARTKTITPQKLARASRLVAEKGRAYLHKKKYIVVQVFATNKMDLYNLQDVFGGGVSNHRKGYVWSLQKRGNVKRLAREARQYLPEEHGLTLLYQSLTGVAED